MGSSIRPKQGYSPENPFAKRQTLPAIGDYSPENPFAREDESQDEPMRLRPVVVSRPAFDPKDPLGDVLRKAGEAPNRPPVLGKLHAIGQLPDKTATRQTRGRTSIPLVGVREPSRSRIPTLSEATRDLNVPASKRDVGGLPKQAPLFPRQTGRDLGIETDFADVPRDVQQKATLEALLAAATQRPDKTRTTETRDPEVERREKATAYYRDPMAVASARGQLQRIARGSVTTNPETGEAYTEQDRKLAEAFDQNLRARIDREEAKGGFGRRALSAFGSGTANAPLHREIREAAERGDLVTEDDLRSLGVRTKGGNLLRTEPTLRENIVEEMLPSMAGQLPYFASGPVAAEGKLLSKAGQELTKRGAKGMGAALRRIGADEITSPTFAGRLGQRAARGAVQGTVPGTALEVARGKAEGRNLSDILSDLPASMALGAGLGAVSDPLIGLLADAARAMPNYRQLSNKGKSLLGSLRNRDASNMEIPTNIMSRLSTRDRQLVEEWLATAPDQRVGITLEELGTGRRAPQPEAPRPSGVSSWDEGVPGMEIPMQRGGAELASTPPRNAGVAVAPERAATHPGAVEIRRMDVDQIVPDPERFQYKRGGDEGTGAGPELKGLSTFDEQLAGVISVWRDPSTGIVHPVNGHNRLALAKRTGHPSVNVQVLPAKTAEEARAMGALANIAEGRGTPLDAAEFFRSSGLGIDALRDRVSFKGSIARLGLGLSKLPQDLFAKVQRGELSESHGAVIGDELPTEQLQRAAVQAIESSGKRLTDGEVREVARQVGAVGSETVNQENLFGSEAVEIPLFVERAQIAAAVKKRLANDKRLFGYVAKEGRAEGLARAGNVIDVESSRRIAQESAQAEEVFSQLYTRSGPIADALTQAARRVANGERPQAVVESIYPAISQAVEEALGGGARAGDSTPGVGNRIGESEGDERVRDSTDPNQDALFSPEDIDASDFRAPRPVLSPGPRRADMLFSPTEGQRGGSTPPPRPASETPERLEVHAIRLPDGTHVEGRTWVDAVRVARDAGLLDDLDAAIREGLEEGYVTSSGRFVVAGSREQGRIAFNAGQLRPGTRFYNALAEGVEPLRLGYGKLDTYGAGRLRKGALQGTPREPESPIAGTIGDEGAAPTTPGPHIVSRAIKVPWPENPDGSGHYVQDVADEAFDGTRWRFKGKPRHYIEGYRLSDGSFVSRAEAEERFGDQEVDVGSRPGADIGWQGRDPESGGALFDPAPIRRERIAAAAVRVDRRTFQAPTHGEAMNEAEHVLGRQIAWTEKHQGYVTESGRFVDEREALRIAEDDPDPLAYDLDRSGEDRLDSSSLRGGRQRMPVREVTDDVQLPPARDYSPENPFASSEVSELRDPIDLADMTIEEWWDNLAVDEREDWLRTAGHSDSWATFDFSRPFEGKQKNISAFKLGRGKEAREAAFKKWQAMVRTLPDRGMVYEPNEMSLFGDEGGGPKASQESLFGAKEGTASGRNLSAAERAARAELDKLRQVLSLSKEPTQRQKIARRIAELEKLVNRDKAISAEELQTRAAAESEGAFPEEDVGPDQRSLFSPAFSPTPIGKKIRDALGLSRPQQALAVNRVNSLRKISEQLAKAVGVPLRQGRFNAKRHQARGVFFPDAEVARVVRMDMLDTAAHEIGHYVSKHWLKNPTQRGAGTRGAPKLPIQAGRELVKMGRDLYGSRKPAGGYGEEGIAQWAKFYVVDPKRLQADAPNFAAWMETSVLANEPALKASLDQARADFEDYRRAGSAARVDAMMSVHESVRNMPDRHDLIRFLVDDIHDVQQAVEDLGGAKTPTQHAGILARLTRGVAGIAEEMLHRGVTDARTGKRVSRGLAEILADLDASEIQAFRRYLIAERALELHGRRVDAGIAYADAMEQALAGRSHPKFPKLAQEIWDISNALLDYREAKGLLTPAEAAFIKSQNQKRVGFYRRFEGEETVKGSRGWGRGFAKNSSGVKAIRGSARQIIDPLENVVTDVYQTVKQSHAAEVMRALYYHATGTEGGGRIIEELTEAPVRPVRVPVEMVKSQLVDLGFEPPDGGLTKLSGVLLAFEELKQGGARETKDLVFPIVIKGDRKWLQVKDAKLFEALQGLGTPELPLWLRILSVPTRVLRAGATLTLEFIGRNPTRDAWTAAIYSRAGTRPPGWDFAVGLFHALRQDETYQRWRLAGGDNAAMLGIDRPSTQQGVHSLVRGEAGKVRGTLLDPKTYRIALNDAIYGGMNPALAHVRAAAEARGWVLRPIDTLRAISSLFENATRIGEYAGVEKKALKRGATPREAQVEAGFASRDITIDFNRAGSVTRVANMLMAFLNANVQGWDKLYRELRERPHVVLPRMFAYITVPSVALYLLQKDDPAYQEVPAWQKAVAWIIVQRSPETGEVEHRWRIPKPPELGILFGTVPERILEWIDTDDPKALDDMVEALNVLNPIHWPDAIAPLIEVWANKSALTGRPIVSLGASRLPAEAQATRYTGEFARTVGAATNTSPAKLEHLIRGYGAGLAQYGLTAADKLTTALKDPSEILSPTRPEPKDALTKVFGARAFVAREPSHDAESIKRMYDDFNRANGYRLQHQRLLKAGQERKAEEYYQKHQADIESVLTEQEGGPGPLRRVHSRLLELQKMDLEITRTVRDKSEATRMQREIAAQMVETARAYREEVAPRRRKVTP